MATVRRASVVVVLKMQPEKTETKLRKTKQELILLLHVLYSIEMNRSVNKHKLQSLIISSEPTMFMILVKLKLLN